VIDEPIRDVTSEQWFVEQRHYRVRSKLTQEPEHVFRLAHLRWSDTFVLSLMIHAQPGFAEVEGLTRAALQSIRFEVTP